MPYLSQYDLSQDLYFRKIVYVAMATAGINVAGEALGGMSPNKYVKRQTLARAVLTAPEQWVAQFALAVVQNPAVALSPPVNISSSTNAFPIVVTTAAAHGLSTGNSARVEGHLVNTSAVGTWPVTVLTSTTFSIPVAGVGAGGATGRVLKLPQDDAVQFTADSIWDDLAGVSATD
jgi:hypothetical protein